MAIEKNEYMAKVVKFDNVDFSKMSREKMFSTIVELIKEYKMLCQDLDKAHFEVEQARAKAGNVKKVEQMYESKLNSIIDRLTPNLSKELDSGKEMSVDEKIYSLIEEILTTKKAYVEEIVKNKETIKENKLLLDELKERLVEKIEECNNLNLELDKKASSVLETNSRENSDLEVKSTSSEEKAEDDEVQETKPSKPESPVRIIEEIAKDEETKSEKITIQALNLNDLIDGFDEACRMILKAVGEEGLSSYPRILKYVADNSAGVSDSKIEISFNHLVDTKVLAQDKATTFSVPRGLRVVSLSENIGKLVYKTIFGSEAVLSEREKMIKENDNINHGYSILDTCSYLEELAYEGISYDRSANTIKFEGQRSWIPDIIATNPITKRAEFFEVEMGTNNVATIEEKLTKANLKASVLKIIVPNKSTKATYISKVANWRNNKKNKPTIKIYVMTYTELRNKENLVPVTELTDEGDEV